jgi:hypothetical protein
MRKPKWDGYVNKFNKEQKYIHIFLKQAASKKNCFLTTSPDESNTAGM